MTDTAGAPVTARPRLRRRGEPAPSPDFAGRTERTLRGEATPLAVLLRDLWASRRLAVMLARKDFHVRYRRASFGLAWALVLPLSQATVLALVLSRVTDLGQGRSGSSYLVFVLSGTVVWGFFSATLTVGSTAIVDNASLSSKVYFPRSVLPLAAVGSNVYGFLLGLAVLLAAAAATGSWPGWHLLLLPLAVLLAVVLVTALSLVLAAVHVYSRDVRYLLEAAQRAWFYVTPVFYPLARTHGLRPFVEANPATGMVELFRAATVGPEAGYGVSVAWSVGWAVALAGLALVLHRRHDRVFADLL